MKIQFAIALLLAASMNAHAVDSGAVVGGAVGGAAGAAVGYNVGGQNGAILGAALGGAAGAAMGSSNKPAPIGQAAPVNSAAVQTVRAETEGDDRHDHGKHRGHGKGKHHHGD